MGGALTLAFDEPLDGANVAFRRLDALIDNGELSPGERTFAAAAGSEPRRREIMAGRAAAHAALRAAGVSPLPEVLTSTDRRPLLRPPCGWHLSIAHDGELAVAACARTAVGVDVVPLARQAQIERAVRSALDSRSAGMDSMSEIGLYGRALLLWSGWEALGKQSGEGVFQGMRASIHPVWNERGAMTIVDGRCLRWWWHGTHLVCLATTAPNVMGEVV
jgi:4'-phosphopantetheinyl transferase N-terminal domain